jgi:hypothetical protein
MTDASRYKQIWIEMGERYKKMAGEFVNLQGPLLSPLSLQQWTQIGA